MPNSCELCQAWYSSLAYIQKICLHVSKGVWAKRHFDWQQGPILSNRRKLLVPHRSANVIKLGKYASGNSLVKRGDS